jgi:hypothetical protein
MTISSNGPDWKHGILTTAECKGCNWISKTQLRERCRIQFWRAKNFSKAAQISGTYTVATSQTILKSTFA